MNRLREALGRFMLGRYGMDDYGQALSKRLLVVLVIGIVFSFFASKLGNLGSIISILIEVVALIFIVYIFMRVFSRNFDKRRDENNRYLKRKNKKSNRKDYKYLTCKECKQEMRVPRGKGRILVTCPKCGSKTEVNS